MHLLVQTHTAPKLPFHMATRLIWLEVHSLTVDARSPGQASDATAQILQMAQEHWG